MGKKGKETKKPKGVNTKDGNPAYLRTMLAETQKNATGGNRIDKFGNAGKPVVKGVSRNKR